MNGIHLSKELESVLWVDLCRSVLGSLTTLSSHFVLRARKFFEGFRRNQSLIYAGEDVLNVVLEKSVASTGTIGGVTLALMGRRAMVPNDKKYQEVYNLPDGECL